MAGINLVILVGNLGQDPATQYLTDGTCVTRLALATSNSYKDKKTGEKKEVTEWHNITFWGKLAEVAAQYLKKGSKAYVEGSIKTEKYTNKQGQEVYATKIVGNKLQLLDKPTGQGMADQRPESMPAPEQADDLPF